MINWIIENKEWFLSGLGVLIVTLIGELIKLLLTKHKDDNNGFKSINQVQKGGKGSTNIQIGQVNKK